VIAVDDRIDPGLLDPLATLADEVVLYPYLDPVDRPVGWLHSLCTQDWILWLDDDELAGADLLRELPELLRRPEETHYWLPRRWLYGSRHTYLAGAPWEPDYQLRLVQNDPRLLWFPGVTHRPIEAVGPHRYLEWPIYHADLLLSPLEKRREKARRYEAEAPGQRLAGLPMNLALHVPELRADIDLRPLPSADSKLVEAVLVCEPWPEPAPAPGCRHATREEVDAQWHGPDPGPDFDRAELRLVDELRTMALHEVRGVRVRVGNRGSHVWPWDTLGVPEVRVSYRWWTEAGELVVLDGLRTPFPRAVRPGEDVLVLASVAAPPHPGAWVLELDLVHEHFRWFDCGLRLPVKVTPLHRVGVTGADEERLRAAAGSVVDLLPGVEPLILVSDGNGAASRVGYHVKPDAFQFIVGSAPSAPRMRIALRAAGLVVAAGARRGGLMPRLGTEPLDGLSTLDGLLDLGCAGSVRERLAHRAFLSAATVLGIPVVHVGNDEERAVHSLGSALARKER
jgi:hypothetical protein